MESSEEIINELIKEYKKEDNLINEQKIIKQQKENLPIFNFKKDLLKSLSEIKENVLIIIGETGSGKSTQISQYLIEANYHKNGIIGITQPRRVGAVSVARRVAEEFGCDIGDEVGYTVRFSNVTSSKTIIKYMTDGILLRECLVDSNLKNYSVIILDEAHERSVNTDILFGLMKMIIKKRLDLKLLITSATLEETKFSSFFHDCPIFIVPGRSFPVEIFYVEERPVDYVEASLDIILKIHENEPQGDILLFLTGQSEIDQACKRLQKKFQKLLIDRGSDKEIKDLLILPLYAALPPSEQVLVFQSTPMNTRKVVIATNIAETSLTVDGIVYVIDPGYVKQKGFNKITGMETLEVVLISKVAAKQRAGRAGRTRPGQCYRMYPKKVYEENMNDVTIPEIQRSNLANVVLELLVIGIRDIINFEFLDPPDPILLIQALKHLYYLGAGIKKLLTKKIKCIFIVNEDGYLTKTGYLMSSFPLEPSYSRMIIASVELKCSEDMITLIAMLSVEYLFYRSSNKKDQQSADEKRKRLFEKAMKGINNEISGDHILLLYIFEKWKKNKNPQKWCQKYFIQPKHMEEVNDIRKQLIDIMKEQKLPLFSYLKKDNQNQRFSNLSNAICYGLFMNSAKKLSTFRKEKSSASEFAYLVLDKTQQAFIHPQSAVILGTQEPPQYLVFTELIHTSRIFMKTVFGIKYEWVEQFFSRKTTLDINRLIGRDIKEVYKSLSSEYNSSHIEKNDSLKNNKVQRLNDDKSIQEAKERYLKRKNKKKE